jgi:hypothetical protein
MNLDALNEQLSSSAESDVTGRANPRHEPWARAEQAVTVRIGIYISSPKPNNTKHLTGFHQHPLLNKTSEPQSDHGVLVTPNPLT